MFSPSNLQFVTTLHRPHRLGVDLTQSAQHGYETCSGAAETLTLFCLFDSNDCFHSGLLPASPGAHYPDTLALTFDPTARHLTCVYNDHSVYVWDVKDVRNARKLYSALYHSSCVWSVEVSDEVRNIWYYRQNCTTSL